MTDSGTDSVTNTVTDIISGRTTQVIAAEINMIKYQAERIYLAAAVEIGRRLTEAKTLLKHGEWGKWLEESVSYSQSTAERLMKVFKEYGSKLLDASDSNSESAPVRNLTYSQAVILLGVPEEGREQFIIDMDIEGMTNQELRKAVNADPEVLEIFDKDVESGKIELVTDAYLREIGMFNIFLSHVKETRILFEGNDLGEVYAISMAKTLGCISLVTDDIKERGPHYTLMRIPDSDVMPFAFYELLFLDYLEERISEQELLDCFNRICDLSKLKMDPKSKLKSFIKRFWSNPYTESEKEWMKSFCAENGINAKVRMQQLSGFLQK